MDLFIPNNSLDSISFTVQEVYDALTNLNHTKQVDLTTSYHSSKELCSCPCTAYSLVTFLRLVSIVEPYLVNGKSTRSLLSSGKTSVTNYRPISLLCIISKVSERLIYNKIIDLVASSLTPLQFGFQRGSSTLQQLLMYFHQLITSKEEIDAIYIDFHKAFDSVPHNELLIKLRNMGVTGT